MNEKALAAIAPEKDVGGLYSGSLVGAGR